jgi:hypothetical protein
MNPFIEIYAVQNRRVNRTRHYETYIDSDMITEVNMHALANAFISQCTNVKMKSRKIQCILSMQCMAAFHNRDNVTIGNEDNTVKSFVNAPKLPSRICKQSSRKLLAT